MLSLGVQLFALLSLFAYLDCLPLAFGQANQRELGHLRKSETGEGFYFTHHDWEIACDNTRTCRAAGYYAENNELKISVLLTRQAGANTEIKVALQIGEYGEDPVVSKLPKNFDLTMRISGRTHGLVAIDKSSLIGYLNAEQIQALTLALTKQSRIEFVYDKHRWELSGKGASAAMLKMDEFQGRLDTPSALARKGSRSETQVRPPVPIPKIFSVPFAPAQAGDESFVVKNEKALLASIKSVTKESDYCPDLSVEARDEPSLGLSAVRLTNTQMLVSMRCWLAAYNYGYGSWLVNSKAPFSAKLVITNGNGGADGDLSASHKGRGLGDCWGTDSWTWNGKTFLHTQSATNGMCRLMAGGGAWSLPVLVTEVVPQPR